ncbi:MAG: PfkB family carbohydrate kinase, partial [Massilibacteroides sp.]|nr:PfkB family carbohydrate kinase [Massilibacteroides sp.]
YNAEISFYCKRFIYTQAAQQVELRAENGLKRSYPVPDMNTVSTIGAGDNFNAGFIYGLMRYGITRAQIEAGLSSEQWDKLIGCAQDFSKDCCQSLFNYVSKEFGEQKKAELG